MKLRFPLLLSAAAVLLSAPAFGQGFSAERALSEPFVGVTTDGTPEDGLFTLEPTGLPVAPVRAAALALLATLSPAERERISFPMESERWRHWANFHRYPDREGLSLENMTEPQRAAVHDLLRASLSAKGYETSRDIMRLNHHLGELVDNFAEYSEFKYWTTIFGDPAGTQPWGWQFEGHHLIINYVLIGDQLVMTPTFMGSEPVRADSGKYSGTVVLQDIQDEGLGFMLSLPPEHRQLAHIGRKVGRAEARGELFKDNIVVPYEGLAGSALLPEHRERLVQLIALYVANMPEGHAALKLEDVIAHLDRTYFAWKGGTAPDSAFYYRIHSPVIFVEFDHQGPIALPGSGPSRDHVHTVVRTPNGNDYGKDLLSEHYEAMKHNTEHGHRERP